MKVSITLTGNGTSIISLNNSIVKKGFLFTTIKYNYEDDPMSYYIKLIKHFLIGKEIYFGFYRTDGINLTNEEYLKYDKEIPEHFISNGRYIPLVETVKKREKQKTYNTCLTVGSLPANDKTHELIPWILHYHLETILFSPNINWDTFVQSYRNYMKHGARDYIKNGYADFIFTYADSGDFSVEFNPNLHDTDVVHQEIMKILSE